MSTGYTDSDSLTRDLRLLDNAVDELRDDLRRLDDRVDTELHDLRTNHDSRLTTIADDLADTTDTANSAATAVQKLADRVEWLSRYIRRGHGAADTDTDMDNVSANTARDLTIAAAGRQAASTLLSTDRRRALQATVDAARNTQTRWQQSADALLAHSRDLAATPVDARQASALRHAARRYRAAVIAYRAATTTLDTTTVAADRARQALTDDDHRRANLQPAITTGETADTRARTRLRTRIADALSSDALLPEWFVITLGFQPARGTAAGAWMDLATDVLAYRITYGITSHTDALGPDPASHPDQNPERRRWYQQIRRHLTP